MEGEETERAAFAARLMSDVDNGDDDDGGITDNKTTDDEDAEEEDGGDNENDDEGEEEETAEEILVIGMETEAEEGREVEEEDAEQELIWTGTNEPGGRAGLTGSARGEGGPETGNDDGIGEAVGDMERYKVVVVGAAS